MGGCAGGYVGAFMSGYVRVCAGEYCGCVRECVSGCEDNSVVSCLGGCENGCVGSCVIGGVDVSM